MMRGPGQAILWQLWRRHHWGLSADLAFLVIAPTMVGLMPPDVGKRPVADVLGLIGVAMLAHLLLVFGYGFEADLAKKESGYPQRPFVLPVSTWCLTSWPAVGGAITVFAAWLVLAIGLWRAVGYATPIFWPGAALAALMGLSQAIGWTPFSVYWMRFMLAIVTVGALVAMAILAHVLFSPNEPLFAGAFAATWGVCFVAAYAGVARSRRGEPVSWRWLDRLLARRRTGRRAALRPFRSPLAAQLWLEMRRQGWFLPAFVATVLVCVVPMLLVPTSNALPAWRIAAIVSSLPPLLAGVVATGFGKADPFQRGLLLPQFIATRPISCARYVAAKMLAAAFTVLISCGMVIAVMLPWLFSLDHTQNPAWLSHGVPMWKVVLATTLMVAIWIALSWRQLAAAIWVALTGRTWVGVASAYAFASFLLFAISLGLWFVFHSEHRELAPALVPWCFGLMLVPKGLVGIWCARQLRQRRLMSTTTIAWLAFAWFAVVTLFCGIALWLLPAGVSIPQLICGIVLLVPFTRLVGAPLALSFNRHR
jgi:hypothetical protein